MFFLNNSQKFNVRYSLVCFQTWLCKTFRLHTEWVNDYSGLPLQKLGQQSGTVANALISHAEGLDLRFRLEASKDPDV